MSDVNDFNRSLIEEFRANEGRTSGPFADAPLLLLTTTGAKSGNPHTTPVVYTTDGGDLVVIASKAGAPTHPAWYHNLKAHPTATVELGAETFEVTAVEATGEDRDRLYADRVEVMPTFADYEKKTTRTIPVIRLRRA